MACAACERRRQAMKAMLVKAADHARRLAGLRKESPDAQATNDVQAQPSERTAAPATGGRQATDTGTAHGKRRVAKAKGAGTGAGRVSVPRVRKAGSGAKRTR